AVVRHVRHGDPEFGRCGDVDVVVADAVPDHCRTVGHRGQDGPGRRREVDERDVRASHRLDGILLGPALVHRELGAVPLGDRSLVAHIAEGVIGDDDTCHAGTSCSLAPDSRPRAARLPYRARIPNVQSGASSAVLTSLTRAPIRGDEIRTMSPILCVKPCPGTSRSSVGSNIVPVSSTKPSGYRWCRPCACSSRVRMSLLISLTGLTPPSVNPSRPVIYSSTSIVLA